MKNDRSGQGTPVGSAIGLRARLKGFTKASSEKEQRRGEKGARMTNTNGDGEEDVRRCRRGEEENEEENETETAVWL